MTQTNNQSILKWLICVALLISQFVQLILGMFFTPVGIIFNFSFIFPYLLNMGLLILMVTHFQKFKRMIGVIFGLLVIFAIMGFVGLLNVMFQGNVVLQSSIVIYLLSAILGVLVSLLISVYMLTNQIAFKTFMIGLLGFFGIMFILNSIQLSVALIRFVYSADMFDGIDVAKTVLGLVYGPLFLIFIYLVAKPRTEVFDSNIS
jgi:hypothetical protein